MSEPVTRPDIDPRDILPWMRDAKGLVPEHFHTFKAVNGRLTCACGETREPWGAVRA